MGKSAINFVAGRLQIVDPAGEQPVYVRGKSVVRKSPRVIKINTCVADRLHGKKFGSRSAVRSAFTDAVKACH